MLLRLTFILRRRWPILVVVPLLACLAGAVFQPSGRAAVATTYKSTAYVNVDTGLNPTTVQQSLLDLKQGEGATAAAKALGITREKAASTLSTKFDDESFVVQVTAVRPEPADAKRYAAAFGDALVDIGNQSLEKQKDEELAVYRNALSDAEDAFNTYVMTNRELLAQPSPPPAVSAQYSALQSAVQQAKQALLGAEANSDVGSANVYRVVNVSNPSVVDVSKLRLPANLRLRVILAGIIGMVGAIGLVALIEKLNPRIDDPAHAERLVDAPVLAMVPIMTGRRSKVIRRVDPQEFTGPFAESFRALRSHLDYRNALEERENPARVMVVSATPGEGKTTTAAFLSLSYTETGAEPVVIGADVRRPVIHQLFDVPRIPGLSPRRYGDPAPLTEVVRLDPVSRVSVVPSGPGTHRVTGLLTELDTITTTAQRLGRPVVVDTAPLMVANDATNFLPAVDWVVVVMRMGKSTERSVRQMITTLRLDGAVIVGCVMVGSIESADAKRYYYSYYADDEAPLPHRLRSGNRAARRSERTEGTPPPQAPPADAAPDADPASSDPALH